MGSSLFKKLIQSETQNVVQRDAKGNLIQPLYNPKSEKAKARFHRLVEKARKDREIAENQHNDKFDLADLESELTGKFTLGAKFA